MVEKNSKKEKVDIEAIKWDEIFDSSLWNPKVPGEELIGVYKEKKLKADSYGRTKYIFGAPGEDNISVFGTIMLDPLMKTAPIGKVIRITYTGSSPGQYQDTKNFRVRKAPEDTPKFLKIIRPKDGGNSGSTLMNNDDPEALSMIEHYSGVVKDAKGKNYTPTAWDIINAAEAEVEVGELGENDLTRIKIVLGELVKTDKIKEGKK